MALKPYCMDCRKSVRSLIEHRTTATHRAATTTVRSTGPKGAHAYRPPMVGYSASAQYAAYIAEAETRVPPSIDDVFPVEIMDPLPAPPPAERGHKPPPCERCGKTFHTPAGATWHRVNNPHCERWAKKGLAA